MGLSKQLRVASQANSWYELTMVGASPHPVARDYHAMVWSPSKNGLYIFGGQNSGRGPARLVAHV